MDVLGDIRADCGRPAFCEGPHRASLALEHQLQNLREPEPTSVDVLLERPSHRVAVECKLMEREFGVCSRPQLEPDDWSYEEQYCDGDYRVQRGRTARCALAEIGVRYWTYLPQLFDWDPDRDLRPCPFATVYQLARNALAATLSADGKLDPHRDTSWSSTTRATRSTPTAARPSVNTTRRSAPPGPPSSSAG